MRPCVRSFNSWTSHGLNTTKTPVTRFWSVGLSRMHASFRQAGGPPPTLGGYVDIHSHIHIILSADIYIYMYVHVSSYHFISIHIYICLNRYVHIHVLVAPALPFALPGKLSKRWLRRLRSAGGSKGCFLPAIPKVPVLMALWSLLDGIWGLLN